MLRHAILLTAVLCLALFVLAACGDDDDGSESTAATPTATPDVVTEETQDAGADETEPAATDEIAPQESALVIPPPRDGDVPQDGRVLGDPSAPVSIVEYGDFQ